jgi:hypothetical protein
MYQYQDPPEIQTRAHRSVVFAVLACIVSYWLWLCILPNQVYLPPGAPAPQKPWWAAGWVIVLPFFLTFIILYLGKLHSESSRLLRAAFMTLLSSLIFLGTLCLFLLTVVMVSFTYMTIIQFCDWH